MRRQQRDGKLKPAWFEELGQLTAIGWTWLEGKPGRVPKK